MAFSKIVEILSHYYVLLAERIFAGGQAWDLRTVEKIAKTCLEFPEPGQLICRLKAFQELRDEGLIWERTIRRSTLPEAEHNTGGQADNTGRDFMGTPEEHVHRDTDIGKLVKESRNEDATIRSTADSNDQISATVPTTPPLLPLDHLWAGSALSALANPEQKAPWFLGSVDRSGPDEGFFAMSSRTQYQSHLGNTFETDRGSATNTEHSHPSS